MSRPAAHRSALDDLDFSDRRYIADRLLRWTALQLRKATRPGAVAALAHLTEPAHQAKMVFVVGGARCGTVALQNGLSSSEEVFVLGEANLFWENLRSRFRARYNAKHRSFGYAPSKLNDCPAVAPDRAAWTETLSALLERYRFVGDKMAFGGYKEGRWPSEFLRFHRHYFHGAAYVLAFRNPHDAILSPRSSWGIGNLVPWARSYIAAQRVLIRLRVHFPRTVPVFLETVGPETVRAIEQCLGCTLPGFAAVVGNRQASAREPGQVPSELRETVDALQTLYPALREAVTNFRSPEQLPALEAIDAKLAQLYQGLDSLHYSIDARMARLRSKTTTAFRMARDAARNALATAPGPIKKLGRFFGKVFRGDWAGVRASLQSRFVRLCRWMYNRVPASPQTRARLAELAFRIAGPLFEG
ncbi:MAG: hypothetical protein JO133_04595, partial [Burkholderiaceae bacterium]|nr:hypothetical protein [Burkholderiaceae bacterium]